MASQSDQPLTEDGRSKYPRREQTVLDDLSATEQILSNTLPESESDSREIKFDETLLNEFKRDYHRCGKYNLESQVVHLGRLADHYKKRYEALGHWTDCLKAHSLYNSCYARKSKSVISAEKAFQMQQAYWNGCTSFSYEDQRTLTESLVGELEAIRTEEKNQLYGISDIVRSFESEPDDDLRNKFSESMKNISLGCSQKMCEFAGRIIRKSVSILGQEPSCGFEAVAIGSLARGDATPYSDLEYIFLIEHENKKSEAYFERLAVTSYFLIGNLGETKLSYMAIEELAGWFNDCSKNGFKIDGLSKEAGNIPTGNGAESRNQFIVTPIKLAERYGHVLNNPDGNQSRRGDLTAMLKFTRSLYVYRQGHKLHKTLRDKMADFVANENRKQANIEMLRSDMAKFRFEPDGSFRLNGCAVDVKRQMYRFPSLLVLDLSICFGVGGSSCWDVALSLNASESFKTGVKFILACASYIRLAAYIFHDSHNDAMSVAGIAHIDLGSYRKSHPQQRWQAPRELFYDFCERLIPLRLKLTDDNNNLGGLLMVEFWPSHWLHKFMTLHFCNNDDAAVSLMMREAGQPTYERIDQLVKDNTPEAYVPYLMSDIADVMWSTGHKEISLQIYRKYRVIFPVHYARALIETGRIAEADDILSIAEHSVHTCFALSRLNAQRGRYDLAEENLMQALQMEITFSSKDLTYSYHGELVTDKDERAHWYDDEVLQPTNVERLLEIINIANTHVIYIMRDLSKVFIHKKQYKLAEKTLLKILRLSFNLYGDKNSYTASSSYLSLGEVYVYLGDNDKAEIYFQSALSIQNKLLNDNKVIASSDSTGKAKTLGSIAAYYNSMENYIKAERFFTETLAMFRRLSSGTDIEDIASTMCNMGVNYNKMKNYRKADEFYTEALAMYRRLSPDTDSKGIACTLRNMGANYNASKTYVKAENHFTQALAMYRRLSPDTGSRDIARILCKIGANYNETKNYIKSEESYIEALEMSRRLAPDTENNDIADILLNMSGIYMKMKNHTKAEDFCTDALEIFRRLSPDNGNKNVVKTLFNMAENYNACKNYIKAEDYYVEALAMFRRLSPSDTENKHIGALLCKMGENCSMMKEYYKADEFYTEALAIHRKLAPNSDIVLWTLRKLGINKHKMGHYTKAVELYTDALSLFEGLYLNHRHRIPYIELVAIFSKLYD